MKRFTFSMILLILCVSFNTMNAQENGNYTYNNAEIWLSSDVQILNNPMLNVGANIAGKTFKATDFFGIIKTPNNQRSAINRKLFNTNGSPVWYEISEMPSIDDINNEQYAYTYLAGYLDNTKYQEVKLKAESSSPFELYLDGEKIITNNDFCKTNTKDKTLKLELGKHDILVKSLYQKKDSCDWNFKFEFGSKNPNTLVWSIDPTKNMDLTSVMHGIRFAGVSVSPNGKYAKYSYRETVAPEGKSYSWSDIVDLESNKIILTTKHNSLGGVSFHPKENAVYYRKNNDGKSQVYMQSLENGEITLLMEASKDMNYYDISNDGNTIIYGINIKGEKSKDGVHRLDGMEDRWPSWRNQTNFYHYNVTTGIHTQLTAGNLSTSLHDINNDGSKIIVSQSTRDYEVRPYSKQIMMEINLKDFTVDTLWNDPFGGSAQYSPDGKSLLVTGSATMFDGAGRNLPKKMIANDYDTEAYIFNLDTKDVNCISKDFDPNIERVIWCGNDNKIYMLVEEKSYNNIYVYDINKGIFEEIETELDNVFNISKAENSSLLAYYGSGIQSPERGFIIDLESNEIISRNSPEEELFKDFEFGDYYDYTYKTKSGVIVDGFYYLPPDFDSSKKYPMIVYYYGGTSPTGRHLRGLYPKNYFAANGYVVYIIIPSGSTGYGQEFAARHVNNWGITVADEIIDATKSFIKDHNFVDAEHVGCMGASYGGFMTELLTTRTDIFAAAISHAGISSISSYWGEGYWGWGYNTVAAAGTFPWDNQKMYVGQSALFNADKVNTPLLLLHGSADTNVPVGESIQLYTALKLLGKECELVQIEGQDHHIVDYKKRIKWHKTIMAWWEKHLKENDEWWEELY